MWWVVGVHDEKARGVFHSGGLNGGGDAGGGGPEERGWGAACFDLGPKGCFERRVFGTLFLNDVSVGDGGVEGGCEFEGVGFKQVSEEFLSA